MKSSLSNALSNQNNMLRVQIFLFFLLNFFTARCFAQSISEINNKRSDTIDVLNYKIKLDLTSLPVNTIQASCQVKFVAKMNNINHIHLDLLELVVDSIKQNGNILSYSYNDTLLKVNLPTTMNTNDTDSIVVFYHGTPVTDNSGFGGFYFQGNYTYNMGVGFEANPHNYGRVWHPCFDNFVERASYEVTVKSPQGKYFYGNGYITLDSIGAGNENIRTWKIDESIPSYLACVGVADYVEVNQTYTSPVTNNMIPIVLAARAVDTTNMKNSFVHLTDAATAFENSYGPYMWNKIGYTAVPFNAGAMEHATCIMYPTFAINGNTQWETMMAHELSHHWWGDYVTCKTAEDMWINEGIAAYSESLFLEHLYNYTKYINNLKTTHKTVIQKAHFDDGGFYPLSGIPHDATYGTHTYSKGAVQMHNLRTYLGDADFFSGLKAIQQQYAHKSIDALEFRDALNLATGKNTTDFFNDYILNPGFNGFEIDSFKVTPQGSNYDVQVFVQQKVFQAPQLFTDVPLQISFLNANWDTLTVNQIMTGEHTSFSVTIPFIPQLVVLNLNSKLLNAVTGEDFKISNPTSFTSDYAYFNYTVVTEQDSTLLRIDHFRMAPDTIRDNNMKTYYDISPDRYWKVDGIWSSSFNAKGKIYFNAKNDASGFLDNGLMTTHDGIAFTEDSLVLLWRSNQYAEWQEFDDYSLSSIGSKTDGVARIDINQLRKGEYTFGFRKKSGYVSVKKNEIVEISIYPNPTKDLLTIQLGELYKQTGQTIEIIDATGVVVKRVGVNQQEMSISTKELTPGTYYLQVIHQNLRSSSVPFVKH